MYGAIPLAAVQREDASLRRVVRGPEPYLVAAFARPFSAAAARVLDALDALDADETTGGISSSAPIYLKGGHAPARVLRQRLAAELSRRGRPVDSDVEWSTLLRVAASAPALAVVLDDAHLFAEADRRFVRDLAQAWRSALSEGGVPRWVLVSDDRRFLAELFGTHSPFHDPLAALTDRGAETVEPAELGALTYEALAQACPEWSAADVIRGYAIFGGLPDVLGTLQGKRSLASNVSRILLDPSGPLLDAITETISARFQKTARYGALLSALASGAETWQDVAGSEPEFGSGSALGAYMKRLRERGFVDVHDSLDAPAGARRKRYSLSDPFHAFWFRFVAPLADRIRAGQMQPMDAWNEHIAPDLEPYVSSQLPRMARQYLEGRAADRLGSGARLVGGLWGAGYDFDAAATLNDGSVVYAHCTWQRSPVTAEALVRARAEVRETRYGFGRERRAIMLFMKHPPTPDLEHMILRDPNVEWIDAERLVAGARELPHLARLSDSAR